MAIRYPITLSTTEPNNDIGLLKIRQADEETQTLVVDITANGQPKSYEGLQPFFCAKLGQSLGLGIIEQRLNPDEMTNPKTGQLEYTFRNEDWQQIGRQVGYFSFRKMKDDGHEYVEQFTTRDFYFTITKNVFSDGVTEVKKDGSTYVWTIEDLIRLFNEYIAGGKSDWEEFVDQNREILESVDPGGMILTELIDSRKTEDGTLFESLGQRLDNNDNELSTQKEITDAQKYPNALNRLVLLDSYDTLDQIHPKVLKFGTQWNGYYWWMAFTPYPNGDQSKENPHILASNDLTTWVEPDGFKNPLDPQPSEDATKQYNSDTHLVFREDLNQLECWWRFVDEENDRVVIYRRTTENGKDWTSKEAMVDWVRSERDCVCPAVLYEDGKYKCWFVNDGYKMWYMESITGKSWGDATEVAINYETNTMRNWHHDIIHTANGYEMVIASFENGTNRNEMSLYYSKSMDGLTGWDVCKKILNPTKSRLGWDNRGIYRSSILYDDGVYYVFYSGINTNGNRGIGISYGTDPTKLKGFQNLEAYIFNNMKAFNMVYGAYLRNYGLKLSVPREDGTLWEAVLNLNNSNDAKLSKTEHTSTSDDFMNLIINAIKPYEALYFQGTSAWLKPSEVKFNDGVNVASMAVTGNGELTVKKSTGNKGSMALQTLTLADVGTPQNPVSGMLRWAESRKKFMYYDGVEWKNVGE